MKSSKKKKKKRKSDDNLEGATNLIKKPQAIAFDVDSKPLKEPKRNRANVKIPKGKDLEKSLRGNLNKRVNNFNADDYKKYKGRRDPNLNLDEEDNKATPEEELENVMKEYLDEREMYDGDYIPGEEDNEYDPGWERYKKVHNIEQDAKAYRKYRKKVLKEQQLAMKQKQKELRRRQAEDNALPEEKQIAVTKIGDLKKMSESKAVKFLEGFVPRMDDMMDYNRVLEDINTLRAITIHHPELMFLGDSRGHNNGSLPLSTLIPYLCDCVDLEDPEIQIAILQYLSNLAYTYKKVLAPELPTILSTLFTLYKKTDNRQIRKTTYTTIKVLSKYSGDLKILAYLLMMPKEMRERYKIIASRMLDVMITGLERDTSNAGKLYLFKL